MRAIFLIILATFFISSGLQAQAPPTAAPASEPRTRVEWSRDTVDFGEIEEGAYVLDSFIVKNTGDAPYIIREIKTTCNCELIKYPKKPILPGQSATIRIEFDSHFKSGVVTPGLVVYDNSIPNRRSILYLKGYIVPRRKVMVIKIPSSKTMPVKKD
jgi:hypothetical protein